MYALYIIKNLAIRGQVSDCVNYLASGDQDFKTQSPEAEFHLNNLGTQKSSSLPRARRIIFREYCLNDLFIC